MTIEAIKLYPPTLCMSPDTDLLTALRQLLEHSTNHAPVCDGKRLLGMISIEDFLAEVLPVSTQVEHGLSDLSFAGDAIAMLTAHLRNLGGKRVRDILQHDVPILKSSHHIMSAALQLHLNKTPLPVVNDAGELLGMLSRRALLGFLAEKAGL